MQLSLKLPIGWLRVIQNNNVMEHVDGLRAFVLALCNLALLRVRGLQIVIKHKHNAILQTLILIP